MNLSIFSSKELNWAACVGLILSVLLLGLVAFTNWFVDPLLQFSSSKIAGVNVEKTELFPVLHRVKPYWLESSDFDGLILGTSRAGNGLNPAHLAFHNYEMFNYGVPGARIDLVYDIYRSVAATKTIDQLILTLDFFAFNQAPSAVTIRDEQMRALLSSQAELSPQSLFSRRVGNSAFAFLSIENLNRSILTWNKQSQTSLNGRSRFVYYKNGFWEQILHEEQSQLEIVRQTEKQYMSSAWFPSPLSAYVFEYGDVSSFDSYFDLLSELHSNEVDVKLVISPLHARFQSAFALVDLDEKFRQWKRRLVELNEKAAHDANSSQFELWDFADFSELNQEPIIGLADGEFMQYYIDGQHYTQALGNKILDKLYLIEGDSLEGEARFGSRIDSRNIELHLAEVRERSRLYAETNVDELLDLQASFDTVK